MLFRQCAGGIVFFNDKVLLLQNEKNEWVFPKGVIKNGFRANDIAINRVKEETGVEAKILGPVGETSYEFYSLTRQEPVCNQINWFLMESSTGTYRVNKELGFKNGGFFNIIDALGKVTYSQDKSLLNIAYRKLKELSE
ncbi:NUDIX hydrolase [Candidatus Formimonas warabiya]|uniref:NUDIX hydrolase n=1 Tax=Formimonas warabiya TaxID=1761012 RepID=A0A3G1KP44_FORW1|nr:NUDIX hydrolase [Candidatus Formimonas warabiya]ATW24243.1 NUDIX hydrolase [Candidatus Formimonas warabiya]